MPIGIREKQKFFCLSDALLFKLSKIPNNTNYN